MSTNVLTFLYNGKGLCHMWFVMPAGIFFLILAILYGLGFGLAVGITTWLLEHALIAGIIYVIVRAIAFFYTLYENNLVKSIVAWIFSVVQFLTTPVLLCITYIHDFLGHSKGVLNLESVGNVLIVLFICHLVDSLWVKAAEESEVFFIVLCTTVWVAFLVGSFSYVL